MRLMPRRYKSAPRSPPFGTGVTAALRWRDPGEGRASQGDPSCFLRTYLPSLQPRSLLVDHLPRFLLLLPRRSLLQLIHAVVAWSAKFESGRTLNSVDGSIFAWGHFTLEVTYHSTARCHRLISCSTLPLSNPLKHQSLTV